MAARKKEPQINLLPQKGFASSTTGRILAWILSTFRVIVITTEIIVMIAFLSRFWLDAQNTDLQDEIKEKRAALEASLIEENEFRDKQKRLAVYSALSSGQLQLSKVVRETSDFLPSDALLTNVDFQPSGVEITGVTPNEMSIQQYVVNLQSSPEFEKIGLSTIKTVDDNPNFLQYIITATYKTKSK